MADDNWWDTRRPNSHRSRQKMKADGRKRGESRRKEMGFERRSAADRHSHEIRSIFLQPALPSRSTSGKILIPTGKYSPTRLE
ncbi:hypothetical protein BO71DRAFT_239836 [Aspergillus ellipticus CBS 707.79]|uniref:Uncharacterized protein n=1 Tax=Aspergillus ellipticus CBS 707.79 TaxID=1448320 RepID=A0A319ESZ0_9EURO|nr:hypothetical protein BO71DRAFT_239836 [Aspergillus ellipticus CBS 707.79]